MADETLAAELQKTIEKLQAENALLQQQVTDAANTNEDLQSQLEEAFAANDALTAEIEKLDKKAHVPTEEKAAEVLTLAEYSFEVDGQTYGFNYPKLTRKGVVITPVEVIASEQLQQELIAEGSSMIKLKS